MFLRSASARPSPSRRGRAFGLRLTSPAQTGIAWVVVSAVALGGPTTVHAALPPAPQGEPENPEGTGLGGDVVSYFLGSTHISAIAWLAIGLALCAAETLAPGVFFVWIGASAAIVGVSAYLLPIRFRWQLLLFAGLVVVLVLIGRRVYRSRGPTPGPRG